MDFKSNVDLYKNLLDEYSVTSLSYIDGFEINVKREISAILMSLCLKKKITIDDNGIKILDYNFYCLKRIEAYILKNIVDGKVVLKDEGAFIIEVKREMQEFGLIEKFNRKSEKKRTLKKAKKKLLSVVLLLITFLIFCLCVDKFDNLSSGVELTLDLTALVTFIVYGLRKILGFNVFDILKYEIRKKFAYQLTEKGEEINEKITGLKQYIKKYAMLSQTEKDVLEFENEYLVYSIMFDLNKTEKVERLFKLINIQYEIGKVYVWKRQ